MAAHHTSEDERLQVLRDLHILDTPAEAAYDDIATLASVICRSPIAAVNLVGRTRHWTKAVVGVEDGQGASVSADLSFCAATVREPSGLLRVADTLADPRWAGHPFVAGEPGIRFYAGASIVVDDAPVGVVCVYGTEPRDISDSEQEALSALARQASSQLELRRRNAELQELATTDPLTGLANRTVLHDRLTMALADRRRHGGEVGVLFCDLDGFKAVNDRFGHEAGDRMLCDVADRLRAGARETDTIARIAGDEFVVVCPGLRDQADLDAVEGRLAGTVRLARMGRPASRLSIGAVLAEADDDAATVLRRADAAMYDAKRAAASLA